MDEPHAFYCASSRRQKQTKLAATTLADPSHWDAATCSRSFPEVFPQCSRSFLEVFPKIPDAITSLPRGVSKLRARALNACITGAQAPSGNFRGRGRSSQRRGRSSHAGTVLLGTRAQSRTFQIGGLGLSFRVGSEGSGLEIKGLGFRVQGFGLKRFGFLGFFVCCDFGFEF
jgi:hypothetical protein